MAFENFRAKARQDNFLLDAPARHNTCKLNGSEASHEKRG